MRMIPGSILAIAASTLTSAVTAQVPLDRVDPSIVQKNLPTLDDAERSHGIAPVPPAPNNPSAKTPGVVEARQIEIVDDSGLFKNELAAFTAKFLNRPLGGDELRVLAGGVASIIRAHGFVFATASVPPQTAGNGVLRITVDQGKVDAVRSLGSPNRAVDRVLSRLVTGKPTTQSELESAILLAGDVPGVRITQTRYVRESGFGILLVTISEDKASAYVQVDNRGTEEVGRIRSTALVNLNGLIASGDDFGLIVAQTPVQPSEFVFIGARYSGPVGRAGGQAWISTSYGRTHPGGALRQYRVIGHSMDGAFGYSQPLVRRRSASLWGNLSVRLLKLDQKFGELKIRDDQLATATAGLNGVGLLAGGVVRGDIDIVAGLPILGATHAGDALASRSDGDGRFIRAAFSADWTATILGPLSVRLAATGQLASRPLLATEEFSVGGPSFGRAFDYSERTGEQGIAGSGELRIDVRKTSTALVRRTQLYAFVDGGYADNLRSGLGGGTVSSAGGGFRFGIGSFMDAAIEAAAPLNTDRFDTGSRKPRISVRMSRRI